MRELPRDLVTILLTEAKNQRTPPIDYVVAEDGGRMVHRHDPDIAMAELLEEAATAIAAKDAELAAERAASEKAERERYEALKALERLLASPALADENHSDPEWGCEETAIAVTVARRALEAQGGSNG